MKEIDDVEIGEIGPRSSRAPGRVRRAGLLFAAVLVVAATVAFALGDGSRAWGYAGAFAVTVAIGAGVFVHAHRRGRVASGETDRT